MDKTVALPRIYVNSVSDFFAKGFQNVRILPDENCEDRSINIGESQLMSSEQESPAALRPGEKEDGKNEDLNSQNLSLCYKFLIAPVVDLLEEPDMKSLLFLIAACTKFHLQRLVKKRGNTYQMLSGSALFLL